MTREEALQRIVDNNFAGEYGFDLQILIDCMATAREMILPVTPQPKIGHWIFREIEDTLRWYECDQCGATVVKEYKYCPNCGAKMVGIKDKNGGKQ